jgi:GNAT superfamily N-acetyltransferase
MKYVDRCRSEDREEMLTIINAAAQAYRGVIPEDCWHEPYMDQAEIEAEIAGGVHFWGCRSDDLLVGVMGVQAVRDVDLIRHAYVNPGSQRLGIGAALLASIRAASSRRMLVGTWAAASWAIDFYRRHGFELVPSEETPRLLRAYWRIPERQIATSVVLADRA